MKHKRVFEFNLAESFPHLAAAPIEEAVIQWVARATKPFRQKELQEQLAERLPDYPEPKPQHELHLETRISADGSSTQIRHDTWQGFRLTSKDKHYIVQFTRDGIVFSRLRPYETWEVLSEEALRLWKIFIAVAEPAEVQRLGVRFVNRIAPIDVGALRRYLAKPPRCLESLGLPMKGFLYQNMHDVPGQPFQINVVQTIQPPATPEAHGFGLILDIDVFTTRALQLADEIVQDHLMKMRWLKNKAFFSLVSEKAVKLFEKGEL